MANKRKVPSGIDIKQIEKEVAKLRRKEGWDPSKIAREQPMEALQRLDQEMANDRVYGESDTCEACVMAREESGHETALCQEHFAEAMGF